MKRNYDGQMMLTDLQKKIRAFVEFVLECCSMQTFRDSFSIYIEPDDCHRETQHLRFIWYCTHFWGNDKDNADTRNHEALLIKHFEKFDVLIRKKPHCWEVVVKTTSASTGTHCVCVPCCATPL